MGRTGSLWAYEQTGVVPDAMTLAKGLGGGMPIGALVIGPRLAGVFAPGDHGSTFAGGPVAAAAANAVLDVRRRSRRCSRACASAASGSPRGCASCRGVVDGARARADGRRRRRRPTRPAVARRALLEERLVINATGPRTLRFLPPLVVDAAQIDDALARLGRLLSA